MMWVLLIFLFTSIVQVRPEELLESSGDAEIGKATLVTELPHVPLGAMRPPSEEKPTKKETVLDPMKRTIPLANSQAGVPHIGSIENPNVPQGGSIPNSPSLPQVGSMDNPNLPQATSVENLKMPQIGNLSPPGPQESLQNSPRNLSRAGLESPTLPRTENIGTDASSPKAAKNETTSLVAPENPSAPKVPGLQPTELPPKMENPQSPVLLNVKNPAEPPSIPTEIGRPDGIPKIGIPESETMPKGAIVENPSLPKVISGETPSKPKSVSDEKQSLPTAGHLENPSVSKIGIDGSPDSSKIANPSFPLPGADKSPSLPKAEGIPISPTVGSDSNPSLPHLGSPEKVNLTKLALEKGTFPRPESPFDPLPQPAPTVKSVDTPSLPHPSVPENHKSFENASLPLNPGNPFVPPPPPSPVDVPKTSGGFKQEVPSMATPDNKKFPLGETPDDKMPPQGKSLEDRTKPQLRKLDDSFLPIGRSKDFVSGKMDEKTLGSVEHQTAPPPSKMEDKTMPPIGKFDEHTVPPFGHMDDRDRHGLPPFRRMDHPHAHDERMENPHMPPFGKMKPPYLQKGDRDLSRMGVESAEIPPVKIDGIPPQPGMSPSMSEHPHQPGMPPILPHMEDHDHDHDHNDSHHEHDHHHHPVEAESGVRPTITNLGVSSSVIFFKTTSSKLDNDTMDDHFDATIGGSPTMDTTMTTSEKDLAEITTVSTPKDEMAKDIETTVITPKTSTTEKTSTTTTSTTTETPTTKRLPPVPITKKHTTTITTTKKPTTTTSTQVPLAPKPSLDVPCEFLEKDFMCNVDISCFGEGVVDCTGDSFNPPERELPVRPIPTFETEEYEEDSATIGFFPPELVGRASSKKHQSILLTTMASLLDNNTDIFDAFRPGTTFKIVTSTNPPVTTVTITTSAVTTTTTEVPTTATEPQTTVVDRFNKMETLPPRLDALANSTSDVNSTESDSGNGTETTTFRSEHELGQNVHIPAPMKAIARVKLEAEEAKSNLDGKKIRRKRDTMPSSMPSESMQLALERADNKVRTCKITGNIQCNVMPNTGICTGKGTCKVISVEKSEKSTSEKGVENWAIAVIAICATAAGLTIILLVYLVVTSWKKLKVQPQNGVTTLTYVNSSQP